jgi:hypothetical protein
MDDIFNGTMAEVISRLEARFRPEVIQALVKAAHNEERMNSYEFDEILTPKMWVHDYPDCTGTYDCRCYERTVDLLYTKEEVQLLIQFWTQAEDYFVSVWRASKSNKLVQKCGLGIETRFNFLNPVVPNEVEDLDKDLDWEVETASQRSSRCANRARRRARALGLGRVRNLAS